MMRLSKNTYPAKKAGFFCIICCMKNIKILKKVGLVAVGIIAIIVLIVIVKYFLARRPYYFAGTLETTKVILSHLIFLMFLL